MSGTQAKTWYSYEYKEEDGTPVTYSVQDVTPDQHQPLADYYTSQFLNDETICKHLNWTEDKVSLDEYLALQKEALNSGHSMVVLEYRQGSQKPDMVGAGMYMLKGDDELLQGEGKSFRVLMKVIAALAKHASGKPRPAGAACVTGLGMWVRRDRRRRGIAEAIVRGVLESCKGKGVPHFSAFYSGTGSQRAAAKAGLEERLALEYAQIAAEFKEPSLIGIPEKYIKVYGTDF